MYMSSDSDCTTVAKDINPLILNLNGYNFVIQPEALLLDNYTVSTTGTTDRCTLMISAFSNITHYENNLGAPFLKSFLLGLTYPTKTILASPVKSDCLYMTGDATSTCACFGYDSLDTCASDPTPATTSSLMTGLIVGLILLVILFLILIIIVIVIYMRGQGTNQANIETDIDSAVLMEKP